MPTASARGCSRSPPREDGGDFFFIRRSEPEQILRTVVHLVTERIPRRFGLDPREDVQVLTPMHKGADRLVQPERGAAGRAQPARGGGAAGQAGACGSATG